MSMLECPSSPGHITLLAMKTQLLASDKQIDKRFLCLALDRDSERCIHTSITFPKHHVGLMKKVYALTGKEPSDISPEGFADIARSMFCDHHHSLERFRHFRDHLHQIWKIADDKTQRSFLAAIRKGHQEIEEYFETRRQHSVENGKRPIIKEAHGEDCAPDTHDRDGNYYQSTFGDTKRKLWPNPPRQTTGPQPTGGVFHTDDCDSSHELDDDNTSEIQSAASTPSRPAAASLRSERTDKKHEIDSQSIAQPNVTVARHGMETESASRKTPFPSSTVAESSKTTKHSNGMRFSFDGAAQEKMQGLTAADRQLTKDIGNHFNMSKAPIVSDLIVPGSIFSYEMTKPFRPRNDAAWDDFIAGKKTPASQMPINIISKNGESIGSASLASQPSKNAAEERFKFGKQPSADKTPDCTSKGSDLFGGTISTSQTRIQTTNNPEIFKFLLNKEPDRTSKGSKSASGTPHPMAVTPGPSEMLKDGSPSRSPLLPTASGDVQVQGGSPINGVVRDGHGRNPSVGMFGLAFRPGTSLPSEGRNIAEREKEPSEAAILPTQERQHLMPSASNPATPDNPPAQKAKVNATTPTKDRQRRASRSPFRPDQIPSGQAEISSSIRDILGQRIDLSNEGFIYVFKAPQFFMNLAEKGHLQEPEQWVKIGITRNLTERLEILRKKCGITDLDRCNNVLEYPMSMPLLRRVEKLCHAELANFKRNFDCKEMAVSSCETVHKEWFNVPEERAVKTVTRWLTFIAQDPYDWRGALQGFWYERVAESKYWRTTMDTWLDTNIQVYQTMAEKAKAKQGENAETE